MAGAINTKSDRLNSMCIVNGWPSVGLHIYLDVLVYKSAGLDIGLGLDTAGLVNIPGFKIRKLDTSGGDFF